MSSAAAGFKAKGNDAFKAKKYDEAIKWYTEAINAERSHVFFSNRSAAYAGKQDFENAAKDGQECIKIKPDWNKGYFRCTTALVAMKRWQECAQIILQGATYDKNNDMASARKQCVSQYFIPETRKLISSGKIDEAEAMVRLGQKMDNKDSTLSQFFKDIEAKKEAKRKANMKGMSKGELLKEEGNVAFKAANFDKAIECYTKALAALSDKTGKVAISCLNNRAACHQQMSNYHCVIEDASQVLEVEPSNEKALTRRMLSFEGMEKYKLALQDVRACLAINPSSAIANQAQHRITSALRKEERLKKSSS